MDKKTVRPTFTQQENEIIVKFYEEYMVILGDRSCSKDAVRQKMSKWEECATRCFEVSGYDRSSQEIRKRWKNIVEDARRFMRNEGTRRETPSYIEYVIVNIMDHLEKKSKFWRDLKGQNSDTTNKPEESDLTYNEEMENDTSEGQIEDVKEGSKLDVTEVKSGNIIFRQEESFFIANFVVEHSDILLNKSFKKAVNEKKQEKWIECANAMKTMRPAIHRTGKEIKRKWTNMLQEVQKMIKAYPDHLEFDRNAPEYARFIVNSGKIDFNHNSNDTRMTEENENTREMENYEHEEQPEAGEVIDECNNEIVTDGKRPRTSRDFYTDVESVLIAQFVIENAETLLNRSLKKTVSDAKQSKWNECANDLAKLRPAVVRTGKEIKKRWKNMIQEVQKNIKMNANFQEKAPEFVRMIANSGKVDITGKVVYYNFDDQDPTNQGPANSPAKIGFDPEVTKLATVKVEEEDQPNNIQEDMTYMNQALNEIDNMVRGEVVKEVSASANPQVLSKTGKVVPTSPQKLTKPKIIVPTNTQKLSETGKKVLKRKSIRELRREVLERKATVYELEEKKLRLQIDLLEDQKRMANIL